MSDSTEAKQKTAHTPGPSQGVSKETLIERLRELHRQEHAKLGEQLADKTVNDISRNWQGGRVNGIAAAIQVLRDAAPDTAAERDRLREINAELVSACDKIFSLVSYINIHGVGEQPEPVEGCPQLVRVSVEGLNEIIQLIGTTADSALSKAEGK